MHSVPHGDGCVHELFAARARFNPGALAVDAPDAAISYGELDVRSDALANALVELGMGPGFLVGLCCERSAALVVGALGVLKAGAAYLALDPSYPPERLAFMLRNAGASVLVTHGSLAAEFGHMAAATVVADDVRLNLDEKSETARRCAAGLRDLAYVIYTSGSTGPPKAAMIEHRSLLALVRWHIRAFSVSAADRATLLSSPGFDAAVWELWPYLVAGASIHVPDPAARYDASALRDWLVAQRITITFLPTPLAEVALTIDWPAETGLRFMLTGGDTLHRYPPPDLPFALINNYGPTEATVVATSGPVLPADDVSRPPPIGRPIDHVRAFVLDADMLPVRPGSPGELLIGGAGVARGYLNQPDLTKQKFISDACRGEGDGPLYRTGDLVRWHDGDLEFLGRVDDQVKIRGVRIEPGEIASVLDTYPDVVSSFVTTQVRQTAGVQLVAYVVANGRRPRPDELRAHVARTLPDPMVPSLFVFLDQLPLTSNGKVDRSALPTPKDPIDAGADVGLPTTPLELELAGMVAELLDLKRMGVHEDFFVLGGHSLFGAQLVAMISNRFGVRIALRDLFQSATVKGLAAEIERVLVAQLEAMSDEEAERLVTLPPIKTGDLLPSS